MVALRSSTLSEYWIISIVLEKMISRCAAIFRSQSDTWARALRMLQFSQSLPNPFETPFTRSGTKTGSMGARDRWETVPRSKGGSCPPLARLV